jgi:hypothetical protein
MRSFLKLALDAIASVGQKRARGRLLDQLDERTLRDIGLEHEANRARERRRLAMHFGMY